jgi:hypothetical protein
MAVFGSIGLDLLAALVFGLIGGIAAELVDNAGKVSLPHSNTDSMFSMGFIGKMIIGAVAALAFFFVLDTTDPFRFVGATVGAGFGGSAILVAVKEKLISVKLGEVTKLVIQSLGEANETVEKLVCKLEEVRSPGNLDSLVNESRGKLSILKASKERAEKILSQTK